METFKIKGRERRLLRNELRELLRQRQDISYVTMLKTDKHTLNARIGSIRAKLNETEN